MLSTAKPFRLAYFVSHPIQYQAPLLRTLAARPEIELEVFFYSDFSLAAYHDKEFGRAVHWDTPLADGYRHTFLSRAAASGTPGRWEKWRRVLFSREIYRVLREGRFDAAWVHGWGNVESLQAVRAAHRLKVPVLMRGDTNSLAPVAKMTWKGRLKAYARSALLGWLFPRIDAFLAVGASNRQFYQNCGVPAERIFDMPYAVDNAFFQSRAEEARPRREALRAELGLPPDRPVILFAAKLIPKKRAQDLLAAYRELSPDGRAEPEACLLFVGDGALRPELERVAGLTGWRTVRFAGFRNQSELPAFYDLCDVLVLPSDFEPWGLVLNEVMNAARPIIVSDRVGAAPDLVQPGENGYVYPVGDVTALAERLRNVLATPARRKQMGVRSLEIIGHWSLEAACEQLVATLTALRSRA